MPAACGADLREELLARVGGPAARAASRQDAELAAEMDALEAAGGPTPPDDWELCGVVPDPRCGPPDGPDAWLADLPAELLFEYITATEDPPYREAIVAGRLPRQSGDGCGFAAGGAADELPPGPVLAGLACDAWAAGLDRLSDDELIGVLRAARRLASWSAALELAAVTDLATRREAGAAGTGSCAPREHIGDEITAAMTLTARAADVLLDLGIALRRLPATMAALAAGRIDRYRATVIADELAGLGDEHAAAGQPLTALTGRETSSGGSCAGTGPGGSGHGEPSPGRCGHGPVGTVNLTMPLATWLGLSDAPGRAAGYGPLDAGDSRDLAARLAGQRGGRWCITLTGEGGRPVAHGCARTGPGPSGRARPPPRRPPRSGGSPRGAPTPQGWPAEVNEWLADIAVSRLETGDCRHLRESRSYRPPPSLRHLITIRQPTCSFPAAAGPPSAATTTTRFLMTRAAGRVSAT